MPEAKFYVYNGWMLDVKEDETTLYDKKDRAIKTWLHENVKWKPSEHGFMDYMKTKAEIWMIAHLIQPEPSYHIEDYETAWPIIDSDENVLFCPTELTATKQKAQDTLDAIRKRPRTIRFTIKRSTDDDGTSFLYHDLYVTLMDPDMNLTREALAESMVQAVNTYFYPGLDTDNWPELVKYVPQCITGLFGFHITNEPVEYDITIKKEDAERCENPQEDSTPTATNTTLGT